MTSKQIIIGIIVVAIVALAVYFRRRCLGYRRDALREQMVRLWIEHVDRTREFIVATLENLPDADAIGARLQKNQDQIAALIGAYYGRANEQRLAALLHEHIDIAAKIVNAYKRSEPAEELVKTWYKNADEISNAFKDMNRKFDVSKMMRAHLDTTAAYLTARVKKDWGAAVILSDRVIDQAVHMAHSITDVIRK